MSTFPDLSALPPTSSAIFSSPSYNLPQIRAIHKALHAAVDEKRDRLRVQVGSSYRDLLGTADKIVEMGGEMDDVLDTLGRMGARCGRGVVGRKVGGLGEFTETEMGTVGRRGLLEGVVLAVERGLRGGRNKKQEGGDGEGRGERVLRAAKGLVLGRLLVKSFGQGTQGGGGNVEAARKGLESSRRRLLRIVERVLQSVGEKKEQREDVLRVLAAYSLATGSGAKDTLRYFLRVRGEAMKLTFELDEDERTRTADDVLRGMRLYTKTLLDVPALVPTRLTEALAGLKKQPLIKDQALRGVEGLRLDVYERWCGDEIEYFTPFIRHDDLDREQAREMLAEWASKGADVLVQGLEKTLAGMTEFKAIVELRTSVLKLWISEGGRVKGLDTSDLLDRIRTMINEHMLGVVEAKVNKLRLVGSEVSATIEAWREGASASETHDFWDPDSFDIDLTNGAAHFTRELVSRLYGRSDIVSKAVSSYKSWYKVIDDVGQVVEQLGRQRWDNDVDEIEDEETIEQRQQLLSKEDPQALHGHLDGSLVRAFTSLDDQLSTLLKSSVAAEKGPDVAMYLLRVVRDIRSNLPALEAVKMFGLDLLPQLHNMVPSSVAEPVLTEWAENHKRRVVGRALWEGEPELPTSPSPDCFQFLRELSMTMSEAGMDLWYPAMVTGLKVAVNSHLRESWWKHVEELKARSSPEDVVEKEEKGADGDETAVAKTDEKAHEDVAAAEEPKPQPQDEKDLLIQWVFDIAYLRCGLTVPSSKSLAEGLKELEDMVFKETDLDTSSRQRITKASQEYWKRTSLLFGLLT
ncbi:hypothetical protein GE09DRAFT_1263199 [Coniochaeta sp. 2T2.1]|nr:hypothetical protein GE09DRAFT_1263199 [Coniochaeta sp. 2T2.1]